MVGVGEVKSDGGHTPGVGDVREIFTLGDVDGDFTTLGAMFFILSAFILWALLDTKSLHGGIQKLRKTFGVEVVATYPNSFCHLWVWEESTMVVLQVVSSGCSCFAFAQGGESWR